MTAHKPGDPTTLNRLYGRSQGKPLRAGQQALVDTLLPQIAVPVEGPVTAQQCLFLIAQLTCSCVSHL